MSMTAALVMTSCSSDDVQDWPTPTTKSIPYTVTVSQGTRATVDEDLSTLRFAEGDKLSISGTNISGTLDMTSAVGQTSATFSGNLTYTGAGEQPAEDLSLTATLVSAQQEQTYPTNAYCATVEEAVQKYSKLTGTGTYGGQSFQLSQGTAFLNFNITFADGTTAGTTFSAVVSNNGTELCSANVTTTTVDGKVVANFVLPVVGGSTLTNATIAMGSKGSWTITDATLSGKVYNVKKGLYPFTINSSGDKVFFAPGNLQATYDGSNWTWAFAEHQWDYIGNAAGNTSVNDDSSKSFIDGPGTVDLFGWVGASSAWWDGVNKFGITSSTTTNNTYGYGNVNGESMKAEWNSNNLNITNGGTYSWRTPKDVEWRYMLDTRKVTVNGESKLPYGLGNVNGVNGLIILPDAWDGSVHSGFTYGTSEYTDNTYSTTSTPTWSQMESAGCVFLPAAGARGGTSVYDVGTRGFYWASSIEYPLYSANYAKEMDFQQGSLSTDSWGIARSSGLSVRLVRPVE